VRVDTGRGIVRHMSRPEPITAAEYTYTVLLQPEPEGGFTVTCPSLPGLVTYGETVEEALAMAAEAIECYLESLQKDGVPLPESDAAAAPRAEPVSVKLAMA
jgi:antitoxin HicB